MQFEDWAPVYATILADFGFDRGADVRARDRLREFILPFDLARLPAFDGATVAIAGAGPALASELDVARQADLVVAASSATAVCRDHDVTVDAVVTDLDGRPVVTRQCSEEGVPVIVHAHGDNLAALRRYVPTFDLDWVVGTTQAAPRPPVQNFGGFTDGDRAAFLADHFGAARLRFPGWDFEAADSPVKRRKLRWAERLLYWLERRRDEQFKLLDGRRSGIETSLLPVE